MCSFFLAELEDCKQRLIVERDNCDQSIFEVVNLIRKRMNVLALYLLYDKAEG